MRKVPDVEESRMSLFERHAVIAQPRAKWLWHVLFAGLALAAMSATAQADIKVGLTENKLEGAGCWLEPAKPKGDLVLGYLDAEQDTQGQSVLIMRINEETVRIKGPTLAVSRKSWAGKGKLKSGQSVTIKMKLGRETTVGEESSWQPATLDATTADDTSAVVTGKFWCGS
jgi:hypothetical protein